MLDPQVQALLDRIAAAGRPSLHTLTPEQARAEYMRSRRVLNPDPPEVATVVDRAIPGPGGPLPVRIYRAFGTEPTAQLPALVYFHGGGFTIGNLDTHDVVCRGLANSARCAVISVDYRLAPEHKFPAAVDDAVAATRWVAAQADELAIDAEHLAIGGDSAGGNLATVAALIARDSGGPKIAFQLLIYPPTHPPHDTPSATKFGKGYMQTRDVILYFRRNYIRTPADFADWRVAPLLAPDLSRLPPTLILAAGYDVLVDEGKAYADRLAAAGVDVTYKCYDGMIHGFITMGRIIDAANQAVAECGQALSRAFEK